MFITRLSLLSHLSPRKKSSLNVHLYWELVGSWVPSCTEGSRWWWRHHFFFFFLMLQITLLWTSLWSELPPYFGFYPSDSLLEEESRSKSLKLFIGIAWLAHGKFLDGENDTLVALFGGLSAFSVCGAFICLGSLTISRKPELFW